MSKVIGEGTYGCVHKPPLLCEGQTVAEDNTISKLMTTKDATNEMKEYVLIDNADRAKNFYLGKPTQCKLGPIGVNLRPISKCEIGEAVLKKYDDYSLLTMADGGVDLKNFALKLKGLTPTPANNTIMEKFWLDAHRILVGLKVFIENDIVHHDMKQQNIVYNETTNRLNFIDFGLMTSKTKLITNLHRSSHWLAEYHWSFPLEIAFLNKSSYDKISYKSHNSKTRYFANIIDGIHADPDAKSSQAISYFFSMITNHKKGTAEHKQAFVAYLKGFAQTLLYQINPGPGEYDKFINKSVNTIDSYGVGMAFMVVLKDGLHLMTDHDFIRELAELFHLMFHTDLSLRLEIGDILIQYEACLGKHGILKKYDKHFIDHKLMDGPVLPPAIVNAIAHVDVADVILSPAELVDVALSPVKDCDAGKEYNRTTKRCVKVCKAGFSRDAAFKCKKNKTVKVKPVKPCPSSKERNPKTAKCVFVCKPGFSRDANFKCKKNKTVKPMKVKPVKVVKPCPSSKERNPKTGRCIFICKPGYSRDADFKCKKTK